MPFDVVVCETEESLTVSVSPWLRLAGVLPLAFSFGLTVFFLVAPLAFMKDGNNPRGWSVSLACAALWSLPTWVFWQMVQPREMHIHFDERYYEIRTGFRRFPRCTRGRFTDISRLIVWNKRITRADVSYKTSLIWNMRRLPFTETLRVVYNDPSDILTWSAQIAEKLSVPLENKVKNR